MTQVSVGSFAYRLGTAIPLAKAVPEEGYERDLSPWLDAGLLNVSEISGDMRPSIAAAAKETLSKRAAGAEPVDFVVFCGEVRRRGPLRKYLNAVLGEIGLGAVARICVTGNGGGDVYAGLDVAQEKVLAEKSKACLVVSAYQLPKGDPRLAGDGQSMLSDGVVCFVVSAGKVGELTISKSVRIDHTDWTSSPDDFQRNYECELPGVMRRASLALFGENGADLGSIKIADRSTPSPAFQNGQGKRRTLDRLKSWNQITAGGPLLEVNAALEAGELAVGESALISAPTPYAYFGILLTRNR